VLMSTGGLLVTAQAGPIAQSWGYTAAILTLAASLSPLANGGSRIFWGWASDRIGRETAMVIAFVQLVLFLALMHRPEWAVAGLALATAMFLAALLVVPGFPTFVWYTLSLQESSSISHANDWVNGLAALAQNPWGTGLGTTDQTALRAGLKHITGDNLYFKYGVELGLTGLLFFVMTLATLGNSAMRLYRHGKTLAEQRMGMTIWLATIGIAINGISTVAFNSITLGWIFFWLAGATVTVSELRARATVEAERAPSAPSPSPLTLPTA